MESYSGSDEQKGSASRQRIERYKQIRLRELKDIVEGRNIQAGITQTVGREKAYRSHTPSQAENREERKSHVQNESSKAESSYTQSTPTADLFYQTRNLQTEKSHQQEQNPQTEMKDDSFLQQSPSPREQENRFRESRLNDPANTFHQAYNSRNAHEEEEIVREYATRQSRFEAACLDIARQRQERELRRQEDQSRHVRNNPPEYETRQERWEEECQEIARKRQERIAREERERQARTVENEVEYRWIGRDRQERVGSGEGKRHANSLSRDYRRWEAMRIRDRQENREQAKPLHKERANSDKDEYNDRQVLHGQERNEMRQPFQSLKRIDSIEKEQERHTKSISRRGQQSEGTNFRGASKTREQARLTHREGATGDEGEQDSRELWRGQEQHQRQHIPKSPKRIESRHQPEYSNRSKEAPHRKDYYDDDEDSRDRRDRGENSGRKLREKDDKRRWSLFS